MLQGKTDFNPIARPDIQHDLMLKSYQRSAVKPTTRQDGSPLVIGDLWRNTVISDLFDWEWTGLDWVSPKTSYCISFKSIPSIPASNGSLQAALLAYDFIPTRSGYDILVEDIVVTFFSPVSTNNDYFFMGKFVGYQGSLSAYMETVLLYEVKNQLINTWKSSYFLVNKRVQRNGHDITFIQLSLEMNIPAVGYPAGGGLTYVFNMNTRLIHP